MKLCDFILFAQQGQVALKMYALFPYFKLLKLKSRHTHIILTIEEDFYLFYYASLSRPKPNRLVAKELITKT